MHQHLRGTAVGVGQAQRQLLALGRFLLAGDLGLGALTGGEQFLQRLLRGQADQPGGVQRHGAEGGAGGQGKIDFAHEMVIRPYNLPHLPALSEGRHMYNAGPNGSAAPSFQVTAATALT